MRFSEVADAPQAATVLTVIFGPGAAIDRASFQDLCVYQAELLYLITIFNLAECFLIVMKTAGGAP